MPQSEDSKRTYSMIIFTAVMHKNSFYIHADSDDIVRPTKGDKQSKIDGATALFMAIGRAMLNGRVSNSSVYDEEDIAC